MSSIISDLYEGRLDPSARYTGDDKELYQKIMDTLEENEGKLQAVLSDKDKETLEIFSDFSHKLCGVSSADKFALGFKMGANLMLEILKEPDNIQK